MRADEKGLQFTCTVDDLVPAEIYSDDTRLRQILLNLLGHAIKFTALGPRPRYLPPTGITPRWRNHSRKRARSRQPIRVHGPLRTASRPGPSSDQHRMLVASAGSLRILGAEADAVNRRVIRAMVEKLGHHVELVNDGQAALDLLAEREAGFDLLLMDIQMPILDGLGATRQYRARGGRLPVIAMTAHAMARHREQCLAAGMSAYMTKPLSFSVLAETLEAHAPHRR